MSASETAATDDAEDICWESMLEIYRCFLKGPGARERQDSYLHPEVTIWDHDHERLLFGVAGLEGLRAVRDPDAILPYGLVPEDEVVTRLGEVVVCRLMLTLLYREQPDERMRVTCIWRFTDGAWKIAHSHEDMFPVAPLTRGVQSCDPALPEPEGLCAERWAAVRDLYRCYLAGDPVGLDSYLKEDVTIWDAWQEPLFRGLSGLAEMRSHRDPAAERACDLIAEHPVLTQFGDVILGRHVLTARYPSRADERMRVTAVWRMLDDTWKMVHSHEDLLADNPLMEER